MIVATAPATMQVQKTGHVIPAGDLLLSQAYYAGAPWQFEVLQKLHVLANTQGVADEHGTLNPEPASIMFAKMAIARLSNVDLPTPSLGPVSGGSVGMIWSISSKQLEVVFDADQTGAYVLSRGEEILADGDINARSSTELRQALDQLMRA